MRDRVTALLRNAYALLGKEIWHGPAKHRRAVERRINYRDTTARRHL